MRAVGARGVIHPGSGRPVTARGRIALARLVLIAAAWAFGEAIAWLLALSVLAVLVPAILAAAAYVATRDIGWPGDREPQYWRGRRIDRDRWRH